MFVFILLFVLLELVFVIVDIVYVSEDVYVGLSLVVNFEGW